jgi:flagellar M-ring protein FliF
MEQFGKLGPVQAITQFWSSLTSAQKLITSIFVATSVILLVIVAVVATRPKMEVLFSGLEAEDAGAIVSKLQERKIEYVIDGGGAVIKVPSKNVHELRLQMATDGLPQGGTVGFELFDKTNLGMTEFAQKIQYQRALQGELSRTIDQIDSVLQSKVSLALPERDLFDKEDKQPTASVIVKLRPGREMDKDQVAGIVHLVASAVEGLKTNNVRVVDTHGNLLWAGSDGAGGFDARLSSSQMELKQNYEHQMQKNIESMLERVLGPNKAIVRVNTKMDFNQRETNSETYEPVKAAAQSGSAAETGKPVAGYKGVLLSEERTTETYGSKQGQVGGVVGTASALGPVRGAPSPAANVSVEANNGGYTR